MVDVLPLVLRVLAGYLYLLAIVRLGAKRSLSQATPVDFVIAIIIGDMIDDVVWAEVPVSQFAVGVGTIVLVDVVLLSLSSRSTRMFLLLEGGFPLLIRDGVLQHQTLRKEQLNGLDLEHLLRMNGIERDGVDAVHLGTLELSGHCSVLRTRDARSAQNSEAPAAKQRRQGEGS